jgi:hypothetical protein
MKSFGKKAMGIGQVFIFIIAAITFALIMIFGYNSINGFLNSGEQVEFVQFKNNLENSVKKIYTEYGSIRVEKFNLPAEFEQICLVNLDYEPTQEEIDELCSFDQSACIPWEEGESYAPQKENVFLNPPTIVKISVHKISMINEDETPVGFICPKINGGQFQLVLEGKGDHTELMEYRPNQ